MPVRLLTLLLLCTAVPTFGEESPAARVETIRATLANENASRELLLHLVGQLRSMIALPEVATDESLRSALVRTLLLAHGNGGRSNTYEHGISALEQLAVIARPSDPTVVNIALRYSTPAGDLGPDYRLAAIGLLRALLSQHTGVRDAEMERQLRQVSQTDEHSQVRVAAFEALRVTRVVPCKVRVTESSSE